MKEFYLDQFDTWYYEIYEDGRIAGFAEGIKVGENKARYLTENRLKNMFMITKKEMAEYTRLKNNQKPAQRAKKGAANAKK